MKILVVADGFFPGKRYGGPLASVDNYCSLMEEYDCYVVAKNHDLNDPTPYEGIHDGWNERGNCKVWYLPDSEYNVSTFDAIICQLKPDWIYLQSLFQGCVLPCLFLAKKYGIRVMLAPRGELCKGAFRKKYKKLPYIAVLRMLGLLKNASFQATSAEEFEAIGTWLGAKENRIHLLPNIPSIPAEKAPPRQKRAGSAKLVFLSRIHPKKNLLAVLRYLQHVKGNVQLDVYGPLEDEAYWQECQKVIAGLPDCVQVRYCGLVGHEEVHKIFGQYDAFPFPTFSENYGHVIVESLMMGCPVIVSDRTPWLDLEEHDAGWICKLDDDAAFIRAIEKIIDSDSDVYFDGAYAYISEKINLPSIKGEYQAVFGGPAREVKHKEVHTG